MLRHIFDTVKIQTLLVFDKLNRYVAISFDFRFRQRNPFSQFLIIGQYAVVCESKSCISAFARKRMVVIVPFLAALRGMPCMAYERMYLVRMLKIKPVCLFTLF